MPIRNIPVKHDNACQPLEAEVRLRHNGGMRELGNIRRRRGLTQQQLADKADVDQGTISKIETEKGYNYTADMIERLALALDVEPAELFGLPELQTRVVNAIRAISDPTRQAAVLVVVESMADPKKP